MRAMVSSRASRVWTITGKSKTPATRKWLAKLACCGVAPYTPDVLLPLYLEAGSVVVWGELPALDRAVRLSAAESKGQVKIVSQPRITTLDNKKAYIEQGRDIPYTAVSAQGVNTAFKKASLKIDVLPHVVELMAGITDSHPGAWGSDH